MDPIENLINGAIHYEVDLNKNPYITLETIILRLYKKIAHLTRVGPSENEKTVLFVELHPDILEAYQNIRSTLSHDEKACIERILSKDSPHSSDLIKFACCWHKYNASLICKWFAVDGLLGSHPKLYVHDAFSPQFSKHNEAVRALYTYQTKPENIKKIIENAFLLNENQECEKGDTEFERCVEVYSSIVGEDEMKLVAADRKARTSPPQPNKRKKNPPSST